MMTANVTLEGKYYDGMSPVPLDVSLTLGAGEASLSGLDMCRTSPVNTLVVSPRVGRADRFIAFPDGGQVQCADHPCLDQLPHEVSSEGPVAWLEERFAVAVASVAVTVCALLLGYFYGLPAVAESVTARIPVETEVMLGRHALDWLDANSWLEVSRVERETQDSLVERFGDLHRGLAMSPHVVLEFRDSDFLGANAFALPGGAIVLTDQMVELAASEEELLAVLAHEIGHVEGRHGMRQILQSSGVALLAAAVTADAATVGTAVAGLPAILAQTSYSRGFETEADEFAFDLLKRSGISPGIFADLMERLDTESGLHEDFSFLSTHPVTSERIERARAEGR